MASIQFPSITSKNHALKYAIYRIKSVVNTISENKIPLLQSTQLKFEL